MTKLKPEALAKLPKWAQDYITQVERDRDEWREEAQRGNVADSNVTFDPRPMETFGLPRDTAVKFTLASRRHPNLPFDYIEAAHSRPWNASRVNPNQIEIRCGAGRLVIEPAVSNVVYVGVRDL